MSDSGLQARLLQELLDILRETFESVQGIYLDRGTSLFETLAAISAEEASRPVSSTCASIAAQVAHICYYVDILGIYMVGDKPQNVDWGEVWRTVQVVTPDEWEASKARLRESYERTVAAIKAFDTWDHEDRLSGALAIVVHTAYHLGEVRQALCVIKA